MGEKHAARGRIDKRQAILDAAFLLFARQGFAQTGMDAIAAEAGVSKPTIYNHFADKEHLFREALISITDRELARNLSLLDKLQVEGDIRAMLEDVGFHFISACLDESSWAFQRLLAAESLQFPELPKEVQSRTVDRVIDALADRMARLTLARRLDITDPVIAAQQFVALLYAPINAISRHPVRRHDREELLKIAKVAVDTFLRAFGVRHAA